jgi:hypothetical protein
MAAWRSPSTSHEVASDGSPAPREGWRSRLWLLVGAAVVVGLVVGLGVGLLVGVSTVSTGRAEGKPAPKAPVAAGVVTEALEGSTGGWNFELPVFNATTGPVDISLVSLEGANFTLTSGRETDLAPGTWGTVPFSVVANCDVASPGALTSARLRVRAQDGSSVAALPLPGRGSAVKGYHRVVCASADPIPSSELVGVWTVEKVYGPDTWLVGTRQIRFERDGSFVVDRRGGLSSDGVGARGRYRLEGELLTVGVYRSDGCQAPSTATWRVTIRGDQMSMVWIHGVCPGGEPGSAWVLRRTLQGAGSPGAQS